MANEVNKSQGMEPSQEVAHPINDSGETPSGNPAVTTMEKITALRHVLYEDLTGCDAKWTLFVSAAQSYRFLTQLEPFPPQFITNDKIPQSWDIDGLVRTINETPRLHTLLILLKEGKEHDINSAVLDLVYWALITKHYPFLRTINTNELGVLLQDLATQILEDNTSSQAFMLIYPKDSPSELEFQKANQFYRRAFAFYGSQLDTVYSLLSNGFKNFHNPKNNFNGRMLKLYPTLGGCAHKSPSSAAWGFSACGSILSCIAICEYIDNPNFVEYKTYADNDNVQHCQNICISNSDLVRIRYILMYGNRTTDEYVESTKIEEKNWLARNKNILSATLSLVLVVTALTSTKRGGSVTRFCTRNITNALTLCCSSLKLSFFDKFK